MSETINDVVTVEEIKALIDKDPKGILDVCVKEGIYKPHLRMFTLSRRDAGLTEDPSVNELQQLIALDKIFYDFRMKKLPINNDRILNHIAQNHKHEWYVRVPDWLRAPGVIMQADKEYRTKVIMDVQTNFFEETDVPAITTVLAHIQPSTFSSRVWASPFGEAQVVIKVAPPLNYADVITIFHEILKIKSVTTGEKLAQLKLSLTQPVMKFLESGTLPDSENDTLRELAVIAASATPYSAVVNFFLRRADDLEAVDPYSLIEWRAAAMDKDVKYGAITRKDGKALLTTTQVKNVISKLFGKYKAGAKLQRNEAFVKDYQLWDTIRYQLNPLDAAVAMHRRTDYINKAAARFKRADKVKQTA